MNIWKPHSTKQDLALFSPKPITICATGIQWGKTSVGAVFIKHRMHKYRDPRDNFIITAPTYKIMQQATLPEFLRIMAHCGEYHKGDAFFKMHSGGTCWFRTGTDANSVVGITNVRGIWGDEAGLYSLYFHENLQARASVLEADMIYTTSPYSLNWIYSDYIRPFHKGKIQDDVLIVQAQSRENPYFPEKEYERKKATMDPRRFNMIYGGEFHKIEGLVYKCFEEETHIVPKRDFEPGTIFVAGVDWGYTNPAVILVFAITRDHGVFLVSEWYQSHKRISEMVDHAKKLKQVYNIERFYCDPSGPANIAEFNKHRLTALPADNNIRPGIDAMFELISTGKFHVIEGSAPHFVDEISIYHYPDEQDVTADKDVKEKLPVKQNDHAMDAARYPIYAMHLSRGLFKRNPTVPGVALRSRDTHVVSELLKQGFDEEYDW